MRTARMNRTRILVIAGLLVLSGHSSGAGTQQDDLRLTADVAVRSLSPFLSVYRDSTGTTTLEEARQAFADGKFQANRKVWPSFGFTRDTIWIRFALRWDAAEPADRLIELRTVRVDELDWHEIREGAPVRPVNAGILRPRVPELLDTRCPVFPVRLAPGETVEFFLRVHSATSIHVPLSVWSPRALAEAQGRGEAVFSSFFGYMSALIFMSLMFSVFTRDRGFVLYSLSIVTLLTNYFITSGYYAWVHLPAAAVVAHRGFLMCAECTLVLLLFYLRYFFDLRATMPRLDRWMVRIIIPATVLFGAVLLIGPFGIMVQMVQFQSLLLGVFAMSVAMVSWIRGNRVARFYFLGWLAFWILFVWTVLQYQGLVPMPTIPEYPAVVGIAISMTLFFLSMADRVRELRRKADASRVQILELERKVGRELQSQMRQQQQLIRDLHDGIGGLTANVGLLAEIGRREAAEGKGATHFGRIAELASEGGAEIRSLMSSLETRDLQWPDFIVECRRYGDMMLTAHGITFNLTVAGDVNVPGPGLFPGLSLLRVFKESLTNVVKHAGATRVDTVMQFSESLLRMSVRDDGKGVGESASSGRGLANMGARVRELGGTMTVSGDQGTELAFEVPLPIESPESGINENRPSL